MSYADSQSATSARRWFVGAILVLVSLLASESARAQVTVFNDDFNGTSLSSAWVGDGSPEIDPSGSTITVADGTVTFAANHEGYNYLSIWGKVDQLAGLGSSDDWTTEIRFKYSGRLQTSNPTRNLNLLSGMQGFQAHMANAGIDFRLEQDFNGDQAETYNLSWNGNDSSPDGNLRVPDILTNLTKDTFYTVKGHRKPDNTVDIFLDDIYLTTKDVLGTGNPNNFRIGEGAFDTNMYLDGRLVIDYIKVEKAVPPGVAGDFNDDGFVDAADYVMWRKVNGTNSALPNDNDLGTPISDEHYDLWYANFGSAGGGSASSGQVPEPASIACLAIGLLFVTGLCRHRTY